MLVAWELERYSNGNIDKCHFSQTLGESKKSILLLSVYINCYKYLYDIMGSKMFRMSSNSTSYDRFT